MKKFVLLLAIFCLGSHLTNAQKVRGPEKIKPTPIQEIDEIRAQNGILIEANAVDPADVGEADSFGKNVKFFGTATAGVVYVYHSCDPTVLNTEAGIVLGPDDRCLAAPDPNISVTGQFNDIGRIKLPKNNADNLYYLIANHTVNYQQFNANAGPFPGTMTYSPTVTIESEALNDPAAIDPGTGLPMNGSFTTGGFGTKSLFETMPAGAQRVVVDSYTRANTTGLSRQFFSALGLPNNVVNQLFKKPMTIRLNVRVTARLVTFGQFVFSARVMGN